MYCSESNNEKHFFYTDIARKSNKGSSADVSFLFGQARKPTLRQLRIDQAQGSATSRGSGRFAIDIRNAPFISDLETLTWFNGRFQIRLNEKG